MGRIRLRRLGVAADPIILDENKVLLVRRNHEPYRGRLELPGGFLKGGETVEQACIREAKEETGLDVEPLEILGVYSATDRDPRGQVISVAFVCQPRSREVRLSSEATAAHWLNVRDIDISTLGFDHGLMILNLRSWLGRHGTYWSTKPPI